MSKWTKEEDIKLKELVEKGLLTEEIAKMMNRSFRSIVHRRADVTRGKPKMQKEVVVKEKSKPISAIIIQTLKDELGKVTPLERTEKTARLIKKGDTLCVDFSDWHLGRLVRDEGGNELYNEKIFEERINVLLNEILTLLDDYISKGTPIKDVAIISTGDILDGMGIFASQETVSEMSPPLQVMKATEVIKNFILALLNRKLTVNLYGVKGNHGEIRGEGGKQKDPEANWDLMLYLILDFWAKTILKDKKVQIHYSELDYLNFEIQGWKYHIRHLAPRDADTPSGKAKFLGWAKKHGCQVIVSGHWHHYLITDRSGITVIRGGSVSGIDDLAERMAEESEPIQLIWGCSKNRPVSFMYAIDLGKRKRK